ncbi:hypothetical protein DY000_02023203 [Brassica cretica]|uniref:Uncharacterized protein n=1 Tax=Brassica cretica TaxID=69181 RepID=A0ABQ7E9Q9_BRACR|nr:hypothetical protein DY000_02023203 [Brassica cretica]
MSMDGAFREIFCWSYDQFTRGISTLFEHPGATSQSDLPRSLPARATSPERLSQVAPAKATSQSNQLNSLAF